MPTSNERPQLYASGLECLPKYFYLGYTGRKGAKKIECHDIPKELFQQLQEWSWGNFQPSRRRASPREGSMTNQKEWQLERVEQQLQTINDNVKNLGLGLEKLENKVRNLFLNTTIKMPIIAFLFLFSSKISYTVQ